MDNISMLQHCVYMMMMVAAYLKLDIYLSQNS